MSKTLLRCQECNKDYYTYNGSKSKFCSRNCKHQNHRGRSLKERFGVEKSKDIQRRISAATKGENNPNYNNRWTDAQRIALSKKTQERLNAMSELEKREKYGKSNRGLVRSQEYIDNWHATLRRADYQRPKISPAVRRAIGKKSSEKFTAEFKRAFRQTMEDAGHWVPLHKLDPYALYVRQAAWCDRMWDIVPLPADFNDIGVFSSRNNSKGYVRDHIVSRRLGFNEGVFPELLRHPVNCAIIRHSNNSSKRSRSYLSIESLLVAIEEFQGNWKEQQLCLSLVSLYRQSIRWNTTYEQ